MAMSRKRRPLDFEDPTSTDPSDEEIAPFLVRAEEDPADEPTARHVRTVRREYGEHACL